MSVPLLSELKRRRVFRALVGYGIGAFALLQIIEPVMHGLHWPEAVLSYVVVALAIGFPICVTVAWIFDVNEGRVERTVGGGPTGARLAFVLIGIGVLAAMPGLIWYFVVRDRTTAGDTRIPSIAVLPFANLSGKPENEYFSDGIAEEILDELAQMEGLRVVGRTSSFSFKGKGEDLRDIGQKLSVAHVLEGSVRKEGNRVRVTAQLVGTADGYHVWSKTFDRELTGVFAVQDEISRAVVAALKVRLMPGQKPRQRTASNPEVYNEYLLGKDYFHRQNVENLRRAVAAYERALVLDPRFAPAWAGLALATFWSANSGETPTVVFAGYQRALAAAEKAVAADPGLADGYAARGLLRAWIQWDWEGAGADCERALLLNPGDSENHLSYARAALAPLGRLRESIAEGQKATDLDPLSAAAWMSLGVPYWMSGQLDPAQAAFERSLHIFPEQDYAAVLLSLTKLLQKKPREALAAAELSRQDLFRMMGKALALNDLARSDEAHRLVEQMIARYAHSGAYNIAESYAWIGEHDRAFAWLQRAYEQHDWLIGSFLKGDPLLRGLRSDPRLALLLKKMNLPPD